MGRFEYLIFTGLLFAAGWHATRASAETEHEAVSEARRSAMNEALASEIREFQKGPDAPKANDAAVKDALALEENMYRQIAQEAALPCLELSGKELIACVDEAVEPRP